MLSDRTLQRIDQVDSVKDFNTLLNSFEISGADTATREEAIRELKARKSVFYIHPLHTPKNILDDIKAGSADIDDLGV